MVGKKILIHPPPPHINILYSVLIENNLLSMLYRSNKVFTNILWEGKVRVYNSLSHWASWSGLKIRYRLRSKTEILYNLGCKSTHILYKQFKLCIIGSLFSKVSNKNLLTWYSMIIIGAAALIIFYTRKKDI